VELPVDTRAYDQVGTTLPIAKQSERAQREALGRVALLPTPEGRGELGKLWRLLSAPAAERPYGAGRIEVFVDDHDPTAVRFPVHAASREPALPDLRMQRDDWRPRRRHNEMVFTVHLLLDVAPTVSVRLSKRQDRLSLEIDPGPPPHTPRFVSFRVNDHWSSGYEALDLRLAGEPLDVRRLGRVLRRTDGERTIRDLWLVTNRPYPHPPPASRELQAGPQTYRVSWEELPAD